jgi:amino acid transporter
MAVAWSVLILLAVTGVAVAAMLFARKRAPEGSHFADGDRAAGVFGVLATGFALLSGFVVFLAFESYDTARSGASAEARIVAHQFETVQLLPSPGREQLAGELVCYARDVVHHEWPKMRSGDLADAPNRWGLALFRSLRSTTPVSATQQAAFSKYLDERSDREDARADRAHGAQGVIPVPVWIVLFVSALILVVFMLFFADPAESAVVQATMMGGVVVLVTSLLLLLAFLDDPYSGDIGALQPTAMENTLKVMRLDGRVVGAHAIAAPCDASGSPHA